MGKVISTFIIIIDSFNSDLTSQNIKNMACESIDGKSYLKSYKNINCEDSSFKFWVRNQTFLT